MNVHARRSALVLGAALALGLFCSPAPPARASIEEPTLEEAIQWMKEAIREDNDPMRNRMYFRLRILEQENPGMVAPALLPLMEASEDKIAEYGAFVLSWVLDPLNDPVAPKAIDALIAMTRSEKEGRVRHATRALGFLWSTRRPKAEDKLALREVVKDALVGLLESQNSRIRQDAAFALGQLEDPAVRPILEKFLEKEKNGSNDELVVHFTKEALTWIDRYADGE